MWKILHNYYRIKEWHSSYEAGSGENGQDVNEEALNRIYVKTKLENGLLRVWRVSIHNVR